MINTKGFLGCLLLLTHYFCCSGDSQLKQFGHWHRGPQTPWSQLDVMKIKPPALSKHLQFYLKMLLFSKIVLLSTPFLTFFLFLFTAHPLSFLCGLFPTSRWTCVAPELCLCYWKHPSNIPISHDVKDDRFCFVWISISNRRSWLARKAQDDGFAVWYCQTEKAKAGGGGKRRRGKQGKTERTLEKTDCASHDMWNCEANKEGRFV